VPIEDLEDDLLFLILAFIHDTKDSLTAQQLVQKQTKKHYLGIRHSY
jgi:hypothetical protein